MALRQLQVAVPHAHLDEVTLRCRSHGAERVHIIAGAAGGADGLVLVVCNVGATGPMVNMIERYYQAHGLAAPCIVVLPVTGMVPEPSNPHPGTGRAAWEELRGDISAGAALSRGYLLFVMLSSIMGAVGLLSNDAVIVIAAMVVAPLFGPLMGVALSVVIADRRLLRRALAAEAAGLGIAIAIGLVAGMLTPPYLIAASAQVQARAQLSVADIVLALGAGVAGALSLASVLVNAMVGVAVAIALVPPALVVGMGIGLGDWSMVGGAASLVGINIVGGVLAAMVTFRLYRIQPGQRRSFRQALRAVRWVSVVAVAVLIGAAVPTVAAARRLDRSRVERNEVAVALEQTLGAAVSIETVDVTTRSGRVVVTVLADGDAPSQTQLDTVRRLVAARLGVPVSITLHVVPTVTMTAGGPA